MKPVDTVHTLLMVIPWMLMVLGGYVSLGSTGYQEAKDYVKSMCLGKTVYLDIDDEKHYDKYGRVLAVVYAGNVNINQELLKRGYAEVMYIPPSEFNPNSWT